MIKLLASAAGVAAITLAITTASWAADPTEKISYGWTGPNVVGHAGGVFSEFDYSFPLAPIVNTSSNDTGFIGGALIGRDFQFDQLVLDIEGNVRIADLNGRVTNALSTLNQNDVNTTYSVRGQLGYGVRNVRLFAVGGATWAEIDVAATGSSCTQGGTGTVAGLQLGGGVELKATENITLRMEYLHSNYNQEHIALGPPGLCVGPVPTTSDPETDQIRFSFTWRFGNL